MKATILKIIGEEHLSLYQYPGYFVWTYDDGDAFEQQSVYVDKITHLTTQQWVEDGQAFMEYVKADKQYGDWRSLVAHLLWEQGAVGSNPTSPTICRYSSAGRATDL